MNNYLDKVFIQSPKNQNLEDVGGSSIERLTDLITSVFLKVKKQIKYFKQDIMNKPDLKLATSKNKLDVIEKTSCQLR